MRETPRVSAGVNTPAWISAVTLARWQSALAIVLGPYDAAGLRVTDHRALESYAALERGAWLGAVLWLGAGPVVRSREALADPLGSLLAAIVLRVLGALVQGDAGRASPYVRALAWQYLEACTRRPAREPMTWAVECLLRCGAGRDELARLELAVGEVLEARRVEELVHVHERAWECEALARALGSGRERSEGS